MISVWFGILAICSVLYYGVFHSFRNLSIFFNEHALILVFGGTLALAFMVYPISLLFEIHDFFLYGFLLKRKKNSSDIIYNLLQSIYQIRDCGYPIGALRFEHFFIADGIRLLNNKAYKTEEISAILESVKTAFNKKYVEHSKVMLNISKFPPGLGLLGATTGMIGVMMNLGSSGTTGIGTAMGVALTATFWGIALANFVFLPLADYANRVAEEDAFIRDLVIDATVLAKENITFLVIVEIITSRLPVRERFQVQLQIEKLLEESPPVLQSAHPTSYIGGVDGGKRQQAG